MSDFDCSKKAKKPKPKRQSIESKSRLAAVIGIPPTLAAICQ